MSATAILIADFVILSVSIFLNTATVIWMFYIKPKSLSSRCILHLHITQIIFMFFSFKNIFVNPKELCAFVGWIRYYSSLANMIAAYFITYVLYKTLFSEVSDGPSTYDRSSRSNRYYWLELTIYVTPVITLLPFITNSYGAQPLSQNDDNQIVYCTLTNSAGDFTTNLAWSLGTVYIWVWLLIIASCALTMIILSKVMKLNSSIAWQVFKTFGLYPFVTLVIWIPKSIPKFNPDAYDSGETMLNGILGLIYFLIFVTAHTTLLRYEQSIAMPSDQFGNSFSGNRISGDSGGFEFGSSGKWTPQRAGTLTSAGSADPPTRGERGTTGSDDSGEYFERRGLEVHVDRNARSDLGDDSSLGRSPPTNHPLHNLSRDNLHSSAASFGGRLTATSVQSPLQSDLLRNSFRISMPGSYDPKVDDN